MNPPEPDEDCGNYECKPPRHEDTKDSQKAVIPAKAGTHRSYPHHRMDPVFQRDDEIGWVSWCLRVLVV